MQTYPLMKSNFFYSYILIQLLSNLILTRKYTYFSSVQVSITYIHLFLVAEWKSIRRLANLGMPHMYSFGSHVHRGTRMRFIVLPRYGESIEKMLMKNSYKFHVKTALTLASHIVSIFFVF